MKAVVKTKPGVGIEVVDMPMPKIKPSEALVEIKACGICGSDVEFYNWAEEARYRRGKLIPLPCIIGHEPSGVVVEVGTEVKNVKAGDRVASDSWGGCGFCYWCRQGNFNMCTEGKNIGSLSPGAMAKYCAIPFFNLYKMPDTMTFEEGAMAEVVGVATRAFEGLVNFKAGDDVAVLGPGPIGLTEALVMKAAGAKQVFVVGLSVDEKRLALARSLGLKTINADKEPMQETIMGLTRGLGVDVCFDATPSGFVQKAIKLVKPTGQLTISATVEGAAMIDGKDFRRGEIIVRRHLSRNPSTFRRAMDFMAFGLVDVKPLVTHKFRVEDAEQGFQTLIKRQGVKALITPE